MNTNRMKAAVCNRSDKTSRFVIQKLEKPSPKEHEVLIKIKIVSLNAADYRFIKMHMVPKSGILGADVAGIVESVGAKVKRFKEGDEVIGDLSGVSFGGLATYVAAPEACFISKPSSLSFADAASIPMAGVTALQAIRNLGKLKSGQKVLIAGSGGGVGTMSLQLANYFGALVDAVCGPNNVEQSRKLGAIHVFDYTKGDFTNTDKKYDLILAVNGNRSLSSYMKILNSNGICVMVGGSLSQIFSSLLLGRFMSLGSKKIYSLTAKSNNDDLSLIAQLAEDGKFRPVIDRAYRLDQINEAIEYLIAGHTRGKVIIEVS